MHSWALPSLMFAFALINIWRSKGPRFVPGSRHIFYVSCFQLSHMQTVQKGLDIVEIPTVVLMCLHWGLVAGLLRPRPSLEQIEHSSRQRKVPWALQHLKGRPVIQIKSLVMRMLPAELEFVNLLWSPGIDSQPSGSKYGCRTGPPKLHRMAESTPCNRFQVSWNVYKFGLRRWQENPVGTMTMFYL